MIDTDKYEGHTEGEWDLHSMGDGWTIGQLKKIDRTLMQDAPLLLAEVKRLREVLRDVKSDIDSYLNGGWNGVEGWEAISSIIGALGIQTDMDLMMEESE